MDTRAERFFASESSERTLRVSFSFGVRGLFPRPPCKGSPPFARVFRTTVGPRPFPQAGLNSPRRHKRATSKLRDGPRRRLPPHPQREKKKKKNAIFPAQMPSNCPWEKGMHPFLESLTVNPSRKGKKQNKKTRCHWATGRGFPFTAKKWYL